MCFCQTVAPPLPVPPATGCPDAGLPSSEGTEAICRVRSGDFSQAPWYTLPSHLCRFRVRSIMEGLFPGTSSKPDQSNKVRQFTRSVTHLQAHRSEEHTSELQSLMRNSYAVFCLKKKILIQSPIY